MPLGNPLEILGLGKQLKYDFANIHALHILRLSTTFTSYTLTNDACPSDRCGCSGLLRCCISDAGNLPSRRTCTWWALCRSCLRRLLPIWQLLRQVIRRESYDVHDAKSERLWRCRWWSVCAWPTDCLRRGFLPSLQVGELRDSGQIARCTGDSGLSYVMFMLQNAPSATLTNVIYQAGLTTQVADGSCCDGKFMCDAYSTCRPVKGFKMVGNLNQPPKAVCIASSAVSDTSSTYTLDMSEDVLCESCDSLSPAARAAQDQQQSSSDHAAAPLSS